MFARSVLALAALLCLLVWLSRPHDEQIVVLSHRHATSPAKIAQHATSTPTTPATPTTPLPNLEIAIDVAATAAGADALRRVAHARAVDLGRGPELLTTFTAQVKSLTPGQSLVLPGCFKGFTLVRCRIMTGRTHQIRKHLEHVPRVRGVDQVR